MTQRESILNIGAGGAGSPQNRWIELVRQKYLEATRQRRAKPVPYRRSEPKWGIKGTGIYFKKRGKRVLKYNRDTGSVVVRNRKTQRVMKNSPHTREAA